MKTFKQHLNESSDPVKQLEKNLKSLKNHDYDSINNLMMAISKKHNITGKQLHIDFVSRHKKTPDDWIKENLSEDLRKWFKQKWVRMDTKGNIKGDCAREPGEGKPKCLPQAKAHAIGKEARATAARRKRREDPNPERRGAPINVKTEETVYEDGMGGGAMSAGPTNVVSSGAIAGTGGKGGEPGVNLKKKKTPVLMSFRRKTIKA